MPRQRWQIFPPQVQQAQHMATLTQLSPLLAQVLINRGVHTPEQAWLFLDPESQRLPSPLDEFTDLALSVELLVTAIETGQTIAICGDYDADGMTSTALLLRALDHLGAQVKYAIPSRMQEGYGINERIVEEFKREDVSIILTVDNGIAAYAPIARAVELGLTVIITDHHDLPEVLPPAQAILNPKLLPASSPYRSVAGVGVAYILAVCLAQAFDRSQQLTAPSLELFTLGTIADLAPLTGVNRRWVRRGLQLLPKSRIPGIQALIEVAELNKGQGALKPEAIGFRLGPRINAVGRIADPQIVIDMLTTDDVGSALQRALQCEEANTLRRRMCELIEEQAVAWCESQQEAGHLNLLEDRVLVVIQPDWHHGVIGIVASRLVERYGVPVFIGTYEDEEQKEIRGSARSIPEFNVFDALQACDDLLTKYGGHRAAGGFSFQARHLRQVTARLRNFARQRLQPEYLKPLVTVDVKADLANIDLDLYQQIDQLQPCGIENNEPVFWTPLVNIIEQRIIGKDRKHLKLTVSQTHPQTGQAITMKAIAWRWASYYPLPHQLDIAYKIRLNEWQGQRSVELEIVGVKPGQPESSRLIQPWGAAAADSSKTSIVAEAAPKPPSASAAAPASLAIADESHRSPTTGQVPPQPTVASEEAPAEFLYGQRRYTSGSALTSSGRRLSVQNQDGHTLVVEADQPQGLLYGPDGQVETVNLSDGHYFNLVQAGLSALELKRKTDLIMQQDALLVEKDRYIALLQQQLQQLQQQISARPQSAQPAAELETDMTQQQLIQQQESHISQLEEATQPPLADAEALSQALKQTLGNSVWFCLSASTQEQLVLAQRATQRLEQDSRSAMVDYSRAGIAIATAVTQEVVLPLHRDLQTFLQEQGTELQQPIEPEPQLLPGLLADRWQGLAIAALSQPLPPEPQALYQEAGLDQPRSQSDLAAVQQFFQQWEHPMAAWCVGQGHAAASTLHQLSQLAAIAESNTGFLRAWQYQLMQKLVLGDNNNIGLFRQIYG